MYFTVVVKSQIIIRIWKIKNQYIGLVIFILYERFQKLSFHPQVYSRPTYAKNLNVYKS